MLVLTRKEGEALFIGEDIKIIFSAINGSQVKVAIDAPKNVAIVRSELLHEPHKKPSQ